MGGSRTRTVNLNWPKNGYSIPCDIMQKVHLKEGEVHQSVGGEQLLVYDTYIYTHTRIYVSIYSNHNYNPFSPLPFLTS